MTDEEPIAFCFGLLKVRDEDLYLSVRYAPVADRARLAALFAFMTELRRIPDVVSEPPLGEIRLQWWREALDEVLRGGPLRAHPVVAALGAASAMAGSARAIAERMIDARARLLYDRAFSSVDDLAGYLRDAEGAIVALALGEEDADLFALGEAAALARFAPLIAPSLAAPASARARELHFAHRARRLSADDLGRVAFLGLTKGYIDRPDGALWPAAKRLAMFVTILTGRL